MKTSSSALGVILVAGLVAGTLDIGAAVLISGKGPVFILQFIASGLIGKAAAFGGGMATALAGLVLQWVISWIIAAVYVAASFRFPILRRAWVALGLIYGAVIFAVMNYVVMPVSQVHRVPHFTTPSFLKNMAAMLVFGLIIAAFARNRPAAPST